MYVKGVNDLLAFFFNVFPNFSENAFPRIRGTSWWYLPLSLYFRLKYSIRTRIQEPQPRRNRLDIWSGSVITQLPGSGSVILAPWIRIRNYSAPWIRIRNYSAPWIRIRKYSAPWIRIRNYSAPWIRIRNYSAPWIRIRNYSAPWIRIRNYSAPWNRITILIRIPLNTLCLQK